MDLLTTAEASALLNVPIGTLHYWRTRGEGPRSMKLGRRVMYRRSELENFVSTQEQAAESVQA